MRIGKEGKTGWDGLRGPEGVAHYHDLVTLSSASLYLKAAYIRLPSYSTQHTTINILPWDSLGELTL